MRGKDQGKVRRSPRYPFVDLGRAITHASELWAAIGANDTNIAQAWKFWGFGPNSSGGIQTEAALKQFGLLDVLGRGKQRRLKLSQLGLGIVGKPEPSSPERRNWIEKAALNPRIHRELWDHWRTSLPVDEVRTYLIQHRKFQERGADAVIREYQKTMSFRDAASSDRTVEGLRHLPSKDPSHDALDQVPRASSPGQMLSSAENFVNLRFEGDRLILSACVDREGIPSLMRILRANQALIGRKEKGTKKAAGTSAKRVKRRT